MESETVDQELRRTFKRYGFPGGSEVKASAPNAGGLGSIPGSRRSPGERNGNPFQYSCLGNPMDRGSWQATVHRVTESDMTERLNIENDLLTGRIMSRLSVIA